MNIYSSEIPFAPAYDLLERELEGEVTNTGGVVSEARTISGAISDQEAACIGIQLISEFPEQSHTIRPWKLSGLLAGLRQAWQIRTAKNA